MRASFRLGLSGMCLKDLTFNTACNETGDWVERMRTAASNDFILTLKTYPLRVLQS